MEQLQTENSDAGGLSDLTDVLGWRPIATAPTDGSHVQLYRPEIQFVGYYGGADSGWRINAPGLPAMWPLPTHWAPLRKNPNATELTGRGSEAPEGPR